LKSKKCRCGDTYYQYTTLQNRCPKCLSKRAKEAREKKERKELREGRERLKSLSDHLKDAQIPCNKYIRIRDKDDGCISCDKPANWGGQWHASHYRPRGNCSSLRFHPMNIHKSCSECNNFKSGNLIEYRIELIKKIGLENVEWLESQNRPYSWEIDDAKEIKALYREKLKELGYNGQ